MVEKYYILQRSIMYKPMDKELIQVYDSIEKSSIILSKDLINTLNETSYEISNVATSKDYRLGYQEAIYFIIKNLATKIRNY